MQQGKSVRLHQRHESTDRQQLNRLPRLTHEEQKYTEATQQKTQNQIFKGRSEVALRDQRGSPKAQGSTSRAQEVILKNRQRIRQLSLLEKRIVSQKVLPRSNASPMGQKRIGSPRLEAIQKQSQGLKKLVDRTIKNVKMKLQVNAKQSDTSLIAANNSMVQLKLAHKEQLETIVKKDEPVNLKAMIGYTMEMREKMQARSNNLSEQTRKVEPKSRAPTPKPIPKKQHISQSVKAIKKPFEPAQDEEMKRYLRELKSKVRQLESLQ